MINRTLCQKQNLFHIESNEVQFKSDAEDQSSMDLNQEIENTFPTNGNMIEENKTLPNGVVVHTCTLDKFHFPKLHTSKQLKYVHFESKQKQYLQWTKELDLTHAPGATFMCWYRPTMTKMFDNKGSWKKYHENNGTWARLFDFGNGPGKENILTAFHWKSLSTHVYNDNPGNKQRLVYGTHLNVAEGNHWYHYAVTMDRASSTWTFYLNGIPYSHTSGSNGKHYNMLFPADGTRKNQYIGKSNWGYDPYYDGDIGDFRIYKHALSEDEIQQKISEAEKFADEDKKKKSKVELRNAADSVVYQTKKMLEDAGEKLTEEDKEPVIAKLDELESLIIKDDKLIDLEDIDEASIQAKMSELEQSMHGISTKLYEAAAAEVSDDVEKTENDEVVEADFEVVDSEDED